MRFLKLLTDIIKSTAASTRPSSTAAYFEPRTRRNGLTFTQLMPIMTKNEIPIGSSMSLSLPEKSGICNHNTKTASLSPLIQHIYAWIATLDKKRSPYSPKQSKLNSQKAFGFINQNGTCIRKVSWLGFTTSESQVLWASIFICSIVKYVQPGPSMLAKKEKRL